MNCQIIKIDFNNPAWEKIYVKIWERNNRIKNYYRNKEDPNIEMSDDTVTLSYCDKKFHWHYHGYIRNDPRLSFKETVFEYCPDYPFKKNDLAVVCGRVRRDEDIKSTDVEVDWKSLSAGEKEKEEEWE